MPLRSKRERETTMEARKLGIKWLLAAGTAALAAICACAVEEVLCEENLSPGGWTFLNKDGGLEFAAAKMDGERVLRVSNPGGERSKASAWARM